MIYTYIPYTYDEVLNIPKLAVNIIVYILFLYCIHYEEHEFERNQF